MAGRCILCPRHGGQLPRLVCAGDSGRTALPRAFGGERRVPGYTAREEGSVMKYEDKVIVEVYRRGGSRGRGSVCGQLHAPGVSTPAFICATIGVRFLRRRP
jgi:hypothetical protein